MPSPTDDDPLRRFVWMPGDIEIVPEPAEGGRKLVRVTFPADATAEQIAAALRALASRLEGGETPDEPEVRPPS